MRVALVAGNQSLDLPPEHNRHMAGTCRPDECWVSSFHNNASREWSGLRTDKGDQTRPCKAGNDLRTEESWPQWRCVMTVFEEILVDVIESYPGFSPIQLARAIIAELDL